MLKGHGGHFRLIQLILLAGVAGSLNSALGVIRHVDSARPDDSENGLTWATAKKTLQAALLAANAGDQVWVAQGTYYPDEGGGQIPGDRDASFQLESGVEIYGGFKGNRCVGGTNPGAYCTINADCPAGVCVSGEGDVGQRDAMLHPTILSGDLAGDDGPNFANNADNTRRIIFSGADSTAVLDGFVIKGGNCDNAGVLPGGGISVGGGDATIRACRIEANSGQYGGGIGVTSNAAPIFVNCTIIGNTTTVVGGGGGGAYINSASPIFQRCDFISNTAPLTQGGAVSRLATGTSNFIGCRFLGNSAGTIGGAVYASGAGAWGFTSCLSSGNSAITNGGAVNTGTGGTIFTASNSTLSRNSAGTSGGGTYLAASSGTVLLRNFILWGNGDAGGVDQSAQIHNLSGGTVTVTSSDVQGGVWPGSGNISTIPNFVNDDGLDNIPGNLDDDLHLMPVSPCRDSGSLGFPADFRDLDGDGNTAEPSSQDAAGNPRILGATVDMGGLEFFFDCNANGLPDTCDLSCGAADAPCDLPGCGGSQDCSGASLWPPNGIPDECDIAYCGGQTPNCDDCNANGKPDGCDIAIGNLDQCESFTGNCSTSGQELLWTCFDNWNLPGNAYPDNVNSAPNVEVDLGQGDIVVLDVPVTIPSLRIRDNAELELFGASAGLTVLGNTSIGQGIITGAKVSLCASGGGADSGVIGTDKLTVQSGGVFQGVNSIGCHGSARPAEGTVVADGATGSLTANEILITSLPCVGGECVDGGEMILTEAMSVTTSGDLTIDGSKGGFGPCSHESRNDGGALLLSFHTPPSIRVVDQAGLVVGGSMIMMGSTGVEYTSLMPLELSGDWNNHGDRPDCFSFHNGTLLMNGATQTFEAAATDMGQLGSFDSGEYAIGTLEVASGSTVNVVDDFDNNALGQASCEEAVYIGTLILRQNSTLSVNNCRIYYDVLVQESGAILQTSGCGALVSGVSPGAPNAPGAGPTGVNKPRVISIVSPASVVAAALGGNSAIKVNLDRLHHVEPPYTGGPSIAFSSFEGEVRWVGPPAQYAESTANPVPFYASQLQCTPHYQDWSTVGLLHVFGSAITPSSTYRVQTVAAACQGIEDNCTTVSGALTVRTARWGDVVIPFNPPDPTTQPDLGDVGALVNKFRSTPSAPIKARALLAGDDAFGNISTNTLSLDFNFGHIAACVDAFRGKPYPFAIQSCP